MWKYIFEVIAVIFAIVSLVAMLAWLKNSLLNQLSHTLYVEKDPKKYLAILDSARVRTLFNRKDVELMKLNVYLSVNDQEKILECLENLKGVNLKYDERLNVEYLKLLHYATTGDKENARIAWLQIDRLRDAAVSDQEKQLLEECDILDMLYVDFDENVIEKLEKRIPASTDQDAAVNYYRLAKANHYAGNSENVEKYLSLAKKATKDKTYQKLIEECEKQHDMLEKH